MARPKKAVQELTSSVSTQIDMPVENLGFNHVIMLDKQERFLKIEERLTYAQLVVKYDAKSRPTYLWTLSFNFNDKQSIQSAIEHILLDLRNISTIALYHTKTKDLEVMHKDISCPRILYTGIIYKANKFSLQFTLEYQI